MSAKKNKKVEDIDLDEFFETEEKQTKHNKPPNEENSNESADVNDQNDVLYYLDMAQRIKADFENYKRRNEQIAKVSFDNGVIHAVEKLLPVVDAITQAKYNIKDEATLQGFDIINSQFIHRLETLGIKKIEALNKPFDPNFHEAMMTESNPEIEDGIIVQEFQQGFMLGDRVIRHSVVKINKLS